MISSNVVSGLKPVREVSRKPVFLTKEQIIQLIENCPGDYELLLEFLVVSGLCWGEATALQRKDLRLEENQLIISVHKAWKITPGGMEIGAPKTKTSVRDVSLSEKFSKKLIEHVKKLDGNSLIFTNSNTKGYLSNKAFQLTAWYPTLSKCNFFDNPRVHYLRHTHASMLIAA